MIYRKNSACRRARVGTFFFPVSVAGIQLDITGCRASSSKPKVLQTASSISWLTLFLHPLQPTARHLPSSFFISSSAAPFFSRLPAPFKNFSTRHPRNFQITSPFPSSFLKIHPPSTRTHHPCPLRRIARWIGHWGMATWLVNA